jgi:hypothetical protein
VVVVLAVQALHQESTLVLKVVQEPQAKVVQDEQVVLLV